MRLKNSAITFFLLTAASIGLSSCNDDPMNDNFVLNINGISGIPYDENGVWAEVYKTDIGPISFGDFWVNHRADETKYGDEIIKTWYGFCPSRSTDTNDYSNEGFAGKHEWSSITGGGALGRGSAYLVGYYNPDTNPEKETTSCYITFGESHLPQFVYVTNTTYGYYALKNGTPYNKKFGAGDWMKLIFIGIKDGVETGRVEAHLAKDDKILGTWQEVNLMSLGRVTYVKIIVDSSDKSTYGGKTYNNTPNYFCLDNYTVKI